MNAEAYEAGSGPTLVLLHGLGGTWHVWRPVLPLLETHLRVLAVTLPGHFGGPPLPSDQPTSVAVLADALEADLDRRGIGQAHFAGNSLGGWLALEMQRRGRALSVTALSPAGAWRTQKDYQAVARSFRWVYALLPLLIVLVGWLMRFAAVRRALNAKAMRRGDRMTADEARSGMVAMREARMLPALLQNMGETGPIKPFASAPDRTCIAWCEHDQVIPFATYGQPMVESVVGCSVQTVSGVGHVPMYDDPQQVADIIRSTTEKASVVHKENAA